jgi:ABC-type iron transport system FetAB permease component
MLLKVNLVKKKEKEMTRSLEEIEAQEKELAAEKKQALKEHKKNAVTTVKKLIVDYKLTKGDIRGKALKQLEL